MAPRTADWTNSDPRLCVSLNNNITPHYTVPELAVTRTLGTPMGHQELVKVVSLATITPPDDILCRIYRLFLCASLKQRLSPHGHRFPTRFLFSFRRRRRSCFHHNQGPAETAMPLEDTRALEPIASLG